MAKDLAHRARPDRETSPSVVALLGCQRSGTTMLVRALAGDWDAKVFGEFSPLNQPAAGARPWRRPRRRHGIRLRPAAEVGDRIARLPYRLVVFKPLVESQHAPALLAAIDGLRCLWMLRAYRDVARSIVETFGPQVHRVNLEPIVGGEGGNWRSEAVAEDVRATVARHYSPDMNPHDGAALFWYARNRLFFDLDLEREPRVALLAYERLVVDPEAVLRSVYGWAGVPFPGPGVASDIHARSVGAGGGIELSAEVAALCDGLWERLVAAEAKSPLAG